MVHLAEGSRTGAGWRRAEPKAQSVTAGFLLVGLTAVAVFAAHMIVSWDAAGLDKLWLGFAIVAFFGLVVALRGLGFGRAWTGASADGPVVIRASHGPRQSDARRHRRFVPARRGTTLHTSDGRQIAARIVDISIAGVAVEARLNEIEFGAINRAGSRTVGPVRLTRTGAVFGFDTLLDPQPFDASFVL